LMCGLAQNHGDGHRSLVHPKGYLASIMKI